MRDSFNSMLMTIGAGSKLSGNNNAAATFAAAATDLKQSAVSSRGFESAAMQNSALSDDTGQSRFVDVFKGELKSFIASQIASSAKQKTDIKITGADLAELASALQAKILESQSESALPKTTDQTVSLSKESGSGDLAKSALTLEKIATQLMKLAAIVRSGELSESPSGDIRAMIDVNLTTSSDEASSSDDMNDLTSAEVDLESSDISWQDLNAFINQWLGTDEDIKQQSLAERSSGEIAQTDIELLVARKINNASEQQLQQLAEITGVDPSRLIELAQQSSLSPEPSLSREQQQTANDLVAKLEQLIKPLANSEQLQAQLAAIKQSLRQQTLSQQGVQPNSPAIEQEIEQRINQPIEQLIQQPPDKDYENKLLSDSDKKPDSTVAASQLTKKIETLISQLSPKEQQQLLAQMKEGEEQPVPPAPKDVVAARSTEATLEPKVKFTDENTGLTNSAVRDKTQTIPPAEVTARTGQQDNKGVAETSLANMPAASMVSNQVSNDKKTIADKVAAEVADDQQASTNNNEAEVKVKPKTPDSFDNLLKQMAMTTAAGSERSSGQNPAVIAESDSAATQLTAGERAEVSALAAKESQSQTKIPPDQVLAKLPLAHDTAAAKMLKERVSMMVTGKIQHAVIQLDPEELGGMNIRLQLQNDQMSVQFQVQNAQAKEMLENAMIKLREMLDQQGIVLKDSDVRHNDQGGQQDLSDQHHQQQGSSDDEFVTDQEAIVLTLHKQSSDGIDYYA